MQDKNLTQHKSELETIVELKESINNITVAYLKLREIAQAAIADMEMQKIKVLRPNK